jgi:hypothetical protein
VIEMTEERDHAYGVRRERAERLAADRAATPAARQIHNSLADQYAQLARSTGATSPEEAR